MPYFSFDELLRVLSRMWPTLSFILSLLLASLFLSWLVGRLTKVTPIRTVKERVENEPRDHVYYLRLRALFHLGVETFKVGDEVYLLEPSEDPYEMWSRTSPKGWTRGRICLARGGGGWDIEIIESTVPGYECGDMCHSAPTVRLEYVDPLQDLDLTNLGVVQIALVEAYKKGLVPYIADLSGME